MQFIAYHPCYNGHIKRGIKAILTQPHVYSPLMSYTYHFTVVGGKNYAEKEKEEGRQVAHEDAGSPR